MTDTTQTQILRYGRILIGLLAIIALNVIGETLYAGRAIILPLAIAVIIVYILNPIINKFEDQGLPSWASVILTLVLTAVLFTGIGTLIKTNIDSFITEFPKYEARINSIITNTLQLLQVPQDVFDSDGGIAWYQDPRLNEYFENFSLTQVVSTILGSIQNILSDTFLVLLFMLFMLSGRRQLVHKVNIAFDDRVSERITGILTNINQQVQKYLIVKTLISLLTASLTMLVLWLFDVEFVIVWGLLTFLLNFIPNIGSVISVILPMGIAIIQFDNIIMVLWLLLCLSLIQIIIGNIIDPKFVGSSINLSPVVVLFALIFWGWLWGVIGMFLSIPIMVIIKIILENIPELKFIAILMSDRSSSKATV